MLALDLIAKWAPMDVEDALELLGPSFRHAGVRQYAVNRLHKSPDDDLQMYLLQLVQVVTCYNFFLLVDLGRSCRHNSTLLLINVTTEYQKLIL